MKLPAGGSPYYRRDDPWEYYFFCNSCGVQVDTAREICRKCEGEPSDAEEAEERLLMDIAERARWLRD